MKTIIKDRRTEEQAETLTVGVIGYDDFMSDWGPAEGRASYACWACSSGDADRVARWVRARKDLHDVRRVNLNTFKPSPEGVHVSIYPVTSGHPATL